jgi:hypothetical protein
MILTKFITFGWSIYLIGYCVRALYPQYGDACQLLYNLGDVVNKVGFGVVVWAAGVAALNAQTGADGHEVATAPASIDNRDGVAHNVGLGSAAVRPGGNGSSV